MLKIAFIGGIIILSITGQAYATETTIEQAGQQFSTDTVAVKVGDIIAFSNKDDVSHNIHVQDSSGDTEDKGIQKPGEVIKHTFAKAGDYEVRCAIHPRMKLAVKVQ